MARAPSALLSCLCGKTFIFVSAVILTGALFYLELLHFAKPASSDGHQHGNDANNTTEPTVVIIGKEKKVDGISEWEAKWARYTDRSTLPGRLTLRGDLEGFKGDTTCNNYQKLNDANELMHMPPEIKCDLIRMVGKGDGPGGQLPYHVCFDRPFRPAHGKCLVYSFGIAEDWSFDDTMAGQMGCNVFSFDPSIGKAEHKRAERIQFYPWGIAANDQKGGNGWEMKSLSSIHKLLGHENETIDIFKIDAEGAEFGCFQQLINDGFIQKYVKQILIEWHPGGDTGGHGLENAMAPYYRLRHEAGFKTFYNEPRFVGDSILLVESLVNTKFAPTK